MISILLQPAPQSRDELIAELWELGTNGIIEEDSFLRAFFPQDADLNLICESLTAPVLQVRSADSDIRNDFSRDDWEPISIGQKFFVAPSWVKISTPPGRLRLTVDSLIAFGTGRHETTQLMLERMEEGIIGGDQRVLDIGCGSGILAAAARMLGAKHVAACDIDEHAVRSVRNEFAVPAFIGSADSLKDACADVLLVNISTRILDHLAPELKRIAKRDATLLLSGFIVDSTPLNFSPQHIYRRNDWLCWVCSPKSIAVAPATPGHPMSHARQWW